MDYIYIGDIINTHGLKGEIRIRSDFKFKDSVFKKGMKIYIGKEKTEVIINSYRTHKIYDMITLNEHETIEDVLIYKGEKAYVNRLDLSYVGYLDEDLIGLDVYNKEKNMGKVVNILKTNKDDILVIENGNRHMVPNIKEFVKNIDLENKRIDINYIKGLANED